MVITERRPILVTPDQQGEIRNIQNLTSVCDFLSPKNFHYMARAHYVDELQENATQHPYRLDNPSYWKLVGAVALESARYGFTEPSGHVIRHDYLIVPKPELDTFHPLYLLSTYLYLADLNNQTYSKKLAIINHWNEKAGINPRRDEKIWGDFKMPHGGIVDFPSPETFFTSLRKYPESRHSRHWHKLPIFIPDQAFHSGLVATGLTRDQLEGMQDGQGIEEVIERLDPILAPIGINIKTVLLDPQETWLKAA